jgi:hypothetical protein
MPSEAGHRRKSPSSGRGGWMGESPLLQKRIRYLWQTEGDPLSTILYNYLYRSMLTLSPVYVK